MPPVGPRPPCAPPRARPAVTPRDREPRRRGGSRPRRGERLAPRSRASARRDGAAPGGACSPPARTPPPPPRTASRALRVVPGLHGSFQALATRTFRTWGGPRRSGRAGTACRTAKSCAGSACSSGSARPAPSERVPPRSVGRGSPGARGDRHEQCSEGLTKGASVTLVIVAASVLILGAILACLVPSNGHRAAISIVSQALATALVEWAVLPVLFGAAELRSSFVRPPPVDEVALRVDALSAFFLAFSLPMTLLGSIYALGYLEAYFKKARHVGFLLARFLVIHARTRSWDFDSIAAFLHQPSLARSVTFVLLMTSFGLKSAFF